ncbi:MAG TPA: hypothetical protein VF008_31075 [Niastella sp.]
MKKLFENRSLLSCAIMMIVIVNTLFSCQDANLVNVNSIDAPVTSATTDIAPAVQPYDIFENFIASGWMGDGKDPQKRYLKLDQSWASQPHSGTSCMKVSYSPGGPEGFAGIVWQNLPNNWCLSPGEDFSKKGYTTVRFWARGEKGGEFVRFKAGGRPCTNGGQYRDSFESKERGYALEKEWKEYIIDITGKNLSSVISGFCWSASASSSKMEFYLDDVTYQ